MQSQLTFGLQVRLVVAGGLNLLLFFWGLDRLGKYSTEEAQAWAHFWLAGTSFLVFALAWPMLRRGSAWLRVGSALLSVLPIWVLFWVTVDYLHRL
jgi:hypothetical protein